MPHIVRVVGQIDSKRPATFCASRGHDQIRRKRRIVYSTEHETRSAAIHRDPEIGRNPIREIVQRFTDMHRHHAVPTVQYRRVLNFDLIDHRRCVIIVDRRHHRLVTDVAKAVLCPEIQRTHPVCLVL